MWRPALTVAFVVLSAALVSSSCKWTFDTCHRTGYHCNVTLHLQDSAGRLCNARPHVRFATVRRIEFSKYKRLCFNKTSSDVWKCYLRPIWCGWGAWESDECVDGQPMRRRKRAPCCHPVTGRRDARLECDMSDDKYHFQRLPDARSVPCPTIFSSNRNEAKIGDPITANLLLTIVGVVAIFVVVVVCQCCRYHVRKANPRPALSPELRNQLLNPQAAPVVRTTPCGSARDLYSLSGPPEGDFSRPAASRDGRISPPVPPPAPVRLQPPNADIPVAHRPTAPPPGESILPPSYEEAAAMPESPPPQYDAALKLVT